MSDLIDKMALICALRKREYEECTHSLNAMFAVEHVRKQVEAGEFDAKPKPENNTPLIISCKECQMIEDLKRRVEQIEKEQADQKEAYPFIKVEVIGTGKFLILPINKKQAQ